MIIVSAKPWPFVLEVPKHEQGGWPFDISGRTEFWMQMAETMIMATVPLRGKLSAPAGMTRGGTGMVILGLPGDLSQ
jgi:hypothetical protein